MREGDDMTHIASHFQTHRQSNQGKNKKHTHQYDVHENPEILPPQPYMVSFTVIITTGDGTTEKITKNLKVHVTET